jgi:CRISPR-associated protein Csc3
MNDTNQTSDTTEETGVSETMAGLLDNYPPGDEDSTREDDTSTIEARVVDSYLEDIDPDLVDAGWGFEAAKSIEYGNTDQSLVNHVRNGIAALARINECIGAFGGYMRDETTLRDAVALFVIHDIHKLNPERDADPAQQFDIPTDEVETWVDRFGLLEWADSLDIEDFHSCAIDHHDDWAANHDQSTPRFDEYRPLVRLADAFASSETPEAASSRGIEQAVQSAYPGASFELRHHVLDDVKGVLTNFIHTAVSEHLRSQDFEPLLVYQEGCVYLVPDGGADVELSDAFFDELFETLKSNIQSSHPTYQSDIQLAENLSTRSHGFYGINDQDFFYAGPKTILEAVVLKGWTDADPDDEPTDSMASSMAELEAYLPFEIDRTREPVGLARIAYTVKKSFVEPVLEAEGHDVSTLRAVCDVFGVDEDVYRGLNEAADELSLTAGGKWDYSYGIGQALIESEATSRTSLSKRIVQGLDRLSSTWRDVVEQSRVGHLRDDLDAYVRDHLSIEEEAAMETIDTSDPFEEYPGSRRGKTCVLCNRGTTSTRKATMKAKKSLTTLQAGYSNHVRVDAGKPEELLVCTPCQIELSLRETGSSRREAGRIWFHLVPDYFYTPLTWRRYSRFTENFRGEARTEIGGLAEAILQIGEAKESKVDDREDDALGAYANALLDPEYGRSMVETLDAGFDPDRHFGARTFSYFKPKDNDTEFQFFGTFLGLALSTYTGLRLDVSASPIPDIRGRDFKTYARLGGTFTQVQDFFGSELPLSKVKSRLRAAAALIQLGFAAEREDALFAKYLRAIRNKYFPGSYLLKRIARSDDGANVRFLLDEARILDDECGFYAEDDMNEESEQTGIVSELAGRAFDVIRPASATDDKPYAVERVFRESVKAIKEFGAHEPSRQDAIDAVAGRVGKISNRSDAVRPVGHEESNHGGSYDERVEHYAEYFVDEIVEGMFNGKSSQLKRRENNLADAFYAATLRLQREQFE